MSKKGWVDIALKEETVDWIDHYLAQQDAGLKSRAQVVELAVANFRAKTEGREADPPASRAEVERLARKFDDLAREMRLGRR